MAVAHRFAPEVVQTSAMDCGPAALAALLGGFGIRADYARLRDACQTDVDGTSIDALEDTATLLGLDAQQVMLPVDHLLSEEAEALPAIVVTRQPGGLTHFVVVWRRHGRMLQVMDPAVGRRWVQARRFLDDVYVHQFDIPAEAFTAWAHSDALRRPLLRGLTRLGVAPTKARTLIAQATDTSGWEAPAALDAAARMVADEVRAGRLHRRRAATRLAELATAAARRPETVDSSYWFGRPADGSPDEVTIRGAVLVRVKARVGDMPDLDRLPADLRAALTQADPGPGRFLRGQLRDVGAGRLATVAVAAAVAAAGGLAEAAVLRALLSAGTERGLLLLALPAISVLLLVLDVLLATRTAAVGRRLESGLRRELLRHLPRLPDRYLRSRPLSDMAERAHRLHRLRELPTLTAEAIRSATQLLLLPVLIGLTVPACVVPAALAAVLSTAAGCLLIPVQAERDLRLRSHVGAVARFYLDAMTGLMAIRSHGAETVFEAEHGRRLAPWAAAVRAVHRSAITAELLQAGIALAFTGWLLASASGRVTDPAAFLLLAYWAAALPATGQRLGALARSYPAHRSTTLRIIEPLATPAEETVHGAAPGSASAAAPTSGSGTGTAVRLDGVRLTVGGRPVLAVEDLTIPAGAQVAVVGRSGSGKSSLAGLLLGWHLPVQGRVIIDGTPLDPTLLARLRLRTAWVDPTVTLWNRPLAENLAYGADAPVTQQVIDDAELADVATGRSADGAVPSYEPLGERGGLLSGGEAQRVRLGRARLRRDVDLAVLDEPFRGLGRRTRRVLLRRVRTWWPGATLLFITHDIADTLAFDRVLVVDGGRVVEDGVPATLAAEPESRYRALLSAEENVSRRFAAPAWRRLRVEHGTVTSEPSVVSEPRGPSAGDAAGDPR